MAKTVINTPFPTSRRVAAKLNLAGSRTRRIQGIVEDIHKVKPDHSKGPAKLRVADMIEMAKLKGIKVDVGSATVAGKILELAKKTGIQANSKSIKNGKRIRLIVKGQNGSAEEQRLRRSFERMLRMAKLNGTAVNVRSLTASELRDVAK